MIRTITVSLLVALAVGWSAYTGLLPIIALSLLPGLILGLLIGVWREWFSTKHQARKLFLEEIARHGGLVEDQQIVNQVNRVGERITAAAGQRTDSITFCVSNSKYIHAFATYPNYVAITMGMYQDFCNEHELASVLAHEVGHIVIKKRTGWVQQTLEECREEEYQADRLAVELAEKAGYDPTALGQLHWHAMWYEHQMGQDIFKDDTSSTHPSKLKRIIAINRLIDWPVDQT